jgi:hypothetical protein
MGLLETYGWKESDSTMYDCWIQSIKRKDVQLTEVLWPRAMEEIQPLEDIVGCGATANCAQSGSHVYVLGVLLLGRIWSPTELCFRDCVRSMGGVHSRPMPALRPFSEIDDTYGGTRDSIEMALNSTSTEECCDKVVARNVVTLSCDRTSVMTESSIATTKDSTPRYIHPHLGLHRQLL